MSNTQDQVSNHLKNCQKYSSTSVVFSTVFSVSTSLQIATDNLLLQREAIETTHMAA